MSYNKRWLNRLCLKLNITETGAFFSQGHTLWYLDKSCKMSSKSWSNWSRARSFLSYCDTEQSKTDCQEMKNEGRGLGLSIGCWLDGGRSEFKVECYKGTGFIGQNEIWNKLYIFLLEFFLKVSTGMCNLNHFWLIRNVLSPGNALIITIRFTYCLIRWAQANINNDVTFTVLYKQTFYFYIRNFIVGKS